MTNKHSAIIEKQEQLIESFAQVYGLHGDYHNKLYAELATLKQGEKEKHDNEINYVRISKVFYFVVMHKIDCYRAFKLSIGHEGYKSPEGKNLIALARQEIGYSDKTWSGDIYSSIYNTYKSIVVDGVSEPEQTPDLDCGIYEEKQSLPYPNPISKHQTDINIGWIRAMKYMGK
jgi:hypothetical protein